MAALSLAACGGGGGGGGTSTATPSSPAAPPEALFVAANAWSGALPPGNEPVTTDEFRRMQAAGELQIASAPNTQRMQDERRTKIEADRAFLESKTDLSAEVIALLAESRASADFAGAPAASLPDGRKVGLVDLGSRIEKAAENYRLSHDPANALRAYELAHALLTDQMKAEVPTPDSLRTSTLEQIKEATKQLNLVLATSDDLDKARLDPAAPVTPQALGFLLNKPTPGNGVDQGGPCTATGIASRYWFPLRYFVSPIKNQGERGTCWAFSAIASVESRERVQNNNPIDLSEQFLVNKTKFEWYPENFVDGGSAAAALNAALDRNVSLMPESQWTYNAASGRPDNAFDDKVAGTAASYVGACTGYSGSCSETAHQARMVCTKWNGVDYCGNEKTVFDG
ncbi:MAG TPA: C1 family peptidase, partial [Steroidobacteraceae bacterium]|nr:C1 family peptidase [Steroidobacteraceae bacterium]